jgi:hypothetical protein
MRILFEADDAILQFDEQNNIYQFGWKGTVGYVSASQTLSLAAELSKDLEKVHWLVDRRNLDGYSPEARIWIKDDFVNKVGKDLIMKIDKIAVMESESPIANLSSSVLSKAILEVNPKIEAKVFDYTQPASNWLTGKVVEMPKEEKSKVRKLFSRKKK